MPLLLIRSYLCRHFCIECVLTVLLKVRTTLNAVEVDDVDANDDHDDDAKDVQAPSAHCTSHK